MNTEIDKVDIFLVGYEEQENLGLRSIMAVLAEKGFSSVLKPFQPGFYDTVLRDIQIYNPKIVGFSIIFQYSIDDFRNLMSYLRSKGVTAHFTAGGHFPSLRPREVLELCSQLDSVVRFEGEQTTIELLEKLTSPEEWHSILGLAFRCDGKSIINTPRPLIKNLDELPFLVRNKPRSAGRGILMGSMLASRGCVFNCAFCSIRQFYEGAGGTLRRARSPKLVVKEMHELFEHDGVRFFSFQDDDFAARSNAQRRWLREFLDELDRTGLTEDVGWKISCRVDDIEIEIITDCIQHGLMFVYLGVESGNPKGLRTLNKHVTVEQNRNAIHILKECGVAFDMGFMLFDPASTFQTVRENIAFLREIASDGSSPVIFCKMLPYAGTPIEAELNNTGRLKGTLCQPDYRFLDVRLDLYANFVLETFEQRNFRHFGLVERLRGALFDQALARRFENPPWVDNYEKGLRNITKKANKLALKTLDKGLDFAENRTSYEMLNDWKDLKELNDWERRCEKSLHAELDRLLREYSPNLIAVA